MEELNDLSIFLMMIDLFLYIQTENVLMKLQIDVEKSKQTNANFLITSLSQDADIYEQTF